MLAKGPRLSHSVNVPEESPQRPGLSEVLSGYAAPPWTIQAFKGFLEDRFCSEVLEFIVDVDAYCKYYEMRELHMQIEKSTTIYQLWLQLLSKYISVGAPQEINIPGEARRHLLAYHHVSEPPTPAVLEPTYNLMRDLLAEIFVIFVNSPKLYVTAGANEDQSV
jgi:hypothetical protein